MCINFVDILISVFIKVFIFEYTNIYQNFRFGNFEMNNYKNANVSTGL